MWVYIFLVTLAPFSHAALKDYETWMGVYFQGKKLGFAHTKVEIETGEIIIHTEVHLRMASEGVDQSTTFKQSTYLTPDLRLKHFVLSEELMGHNKLVEAEVKNNQLGFQITSPDFKKKNSIPFSSAIAPATTYLLNIVRSGLTIGKQGRISILVEPFQKVTELAYTILRKEKAELSGKQVDAYVVHQKMRGMESTSWVTTSGMVLREETFDGFKSILEPKSVATDFGEEVFSTGSFIVSSLIRPKHEIVKPRNIDRIKLLVSGMSSPDLIPKDHRQKVLATKKLTSGAYESIVVIESESSSFEKAANFPVLVKNSDPDHLLGSSPEVQVNNPEILSLSSLLAEGETDSWRLARIINRWVYENMEKSLVDTVTAVDALRERRGECQSHTYLFTALARAAGIPTKIVNGLVYSEDYSGFLYHAWPEVFVGQWRALDPTLGQDRVDATHIKITGNENEDPFKLLELVGRISIEILD